MLEEKMVYTHCTHRISLRHGLPTEFGGPYRPADRSRRQKLANLVAKPPDLSGDKKKQFTRNPAENLLVLAVKEGSILGGVVRPQASRQDLRSSTSPGNTPQFNRREWESSLYELSTSFSLYRELECFGISAPTLPQVPDRVRPRIAS